MITPPKPNPRSEYREQQSQRVESSSTLADQFKELDGLVAELTHFDREGLCRNRAIKYTFNVAHARSVLRFDCSNEDCVGGDFDLSAELAKAVAERETSVSGEMTCQGWQDKHTMGQERCGNVLRYKLTLQFKNGNGRARGK